MLNFITSISSIIEGFIPVVFELSQSNGGQGEADRLALTDQITAAGITKMTYVKQPANCRIWDKPIMDLTDNGVMEDISAGVNTSQYVSFSRTFGAEISICPLLRDNTDNTAYYIKAMQGGTPLYPQSGDDWSASSTNELLDQALDIYATPAIRQIISENPGKQIKVCLLRHQGESDSTDVERNAYYDESVAFLNKIRSYQIDGVNYFSEAPFVDVLLHYALDAQEGLMNDIKTQFAAEQPNCYTIDISAQPRKIDLTTEQKGGYSPTLTDNNHTSYLGQLHKGEQLYDKLIEIGWI